MVDKPGSGSSSPLARLLCRETKRQLPINCVRTEVPVTVGFTAAFCALAIVLNAKNATARRVNSILRALGNLLPRYISLLIWPPIYASHYGNVN
jgi:hypothetical protein